MRVAIDTSALVKRYVAIQGGEELQPIFEEATFSHLLTTSQNHGYAHIEQAFHEKAVTRAASARVIKQREITRELRGVAQRHLPSGRTR